MIGNKVKLTLSDEDELNLFFGYLNITPSIWEERSGLYSVGFDLKYHRMEYRVDIELVKIYINHSHDMMTFYFYGPTAIRTVGRNSDDIDIIAQISYPLLVNIKHIPDLITWSNKLVEVDWVILDAIPSGCKKYYKKLKTQGQKQEEFDKLDKDI